MRCGRDWRPRNSFLGAIFAREGLDFLKYDVIVFETSVSPVQTNTINLRFQKSPLWRAFWKTSVFSDRKRRIRVDGRLKRRTKSPFSKISGYVWTGPQFFLFILSLVMSVLQHFLDFRYPYAKCGHHEK